MSFDLHHLLSEEVDVVFVVDEGRTYLISIWKKSPSGVSILLRVSQYVDSSSLPNSPPLPSPPPSPPGSGSPSLPNIGSLFNSFASFSIATAPKPPPLKLWDVT